MLQYGDSFTLNVSGRWTLVIWDPALVPTTSQYELLLGVNSACSGLDPYEPNNGQFDTYAVLAPTGDPAHHAVRNRRPGLVQLPGDGGLPHPHYAPDLVQRREQRR